MFVAWAFLSQFWAFRIGARDGIAQNSALQFVIILAFLCCVVCCAPPVRVLFSVLWAHLVLLCLIGGAQVALQDDVGLKWLGEFALNPAQSGAGVVQSEGVRWLRPYGFLPHPNIFAGMLLASLLSLLPPLWRGSWVALGAWGAGWWVFLLTFSRGAWLAFAVCFGAMLAVSWVKRRVDWRVLLRPVAVCFVLGLAFVALYRPFIVARAGFGTENTELRSVADRVVFTEIALYIIERHPIQGIGTGNYPSFSNNYIRTRTFYDLRGDNVHNIWLLVTTELGVIGLGLFGGMVLSGMGGMVSHIRRHPHDWEMYALLAIAASFAFIGLVDHYPYTLVMCVLVWQGCIAWGLNKT